MVNKNKLNAIFVQFFCLILFYLAVKNIIGLLLMYYGFRFYVYCFGGGCVYVFLVLFKKF